MSRDTFMARIKLSLSAEPGDGRKAVAQARLKSPPQHPLPMRAQAAGDAAVETFASHLEAQGTIIERAASQADVAKVIAALMTKLHPGIGVTVGADPWLKALAWDTVPQLSRQAWREGDIPIVGLSRATAGIAETGTLVMASGVDNPASLNYLPETHIVVIEKAMIGGSMEAGLEAARQRSAKFKLPRTLGLISGASRTADVGGKLVRGAHGPRTLAVIIVG